MKPLTVSSWTSGFAPDVISLWLYKSGFRKPHQNATCKVLIQRPTLSALAGFGKHMFFCPIWLLHTDFI